MCLQKETKDLSLKLNLHNNFTENFIHFKVLLFHHKSKEQRTLFGIL